MQESISRGQKLQFQTFGTSLYSTTHPKALYHFYNEAMEEREEEMELEENCWEVVLVVIMVSQREFSLRQ